MTHKIRVLCVDDHPDVREAICAALDMEPDIITVGGLSSADDLVETAAELKPDVVVLDLTMPGRNPLEALQELTRQRPDTRTVVLSGYDDQESIDRALDHGAYGYVSKDTDMPALARAVRRIAAGEVVLPGHARGA